jgi:hypothetical protein
MLDSFIKIIKLKFLLSLCLLSTACGDMFNEGSKLELELARPYLNKDSKQDCQSENRLDMASNCNVMRFYKGRVEKQPEMTSYQYGSHLLFGSLIDGALENDTEKTYAIVSDVVDLTPWLGKNVVITGVFADGYPVEGGPELIQVTSIEEDKKIGGFD